MLMSWLHSRLKGTNPLLCRHILKYKISYVYNYDSFLALNWQAKNSPYVLMFVFIIWIVYWEFMFLPNIVHVLIGSNLQGLVVDKQVRKTVLIFTVRQSELALL